MARASFRISSARCSSRNRISWSSPSSGIERGVSGIGVGRDGGGGGSVENVRGGIGGGVSDQFTCGINGGPEGALVMGGAETAAGAAVATTLGGAAVVWTLAAAGAAVVAALAAGGAAPGIGGGPTGFAPVSGATRGAVTFAGATAGARGVAATCGAFGGVAAGPGLPRLVISSRLSKICSRRKIATVAEKVSHPARAWETGTSACSAASREGRRP